MNNRELEDLILNINEINDNDSRLLNKGQTRINK